jgi:hypothetical protein
MNLLIWRHHPYVAPLLFEVDVPDADQKAYPGMFRKHQAMGYRAYILKTEHSSDAVESSTKGLALQAPAETAHLMLISEVPRSTCPCDIT